ncbi:MAG: hypothetical protein ACYDA0_04715, partial [Candidatus Dormibacteraceae bacterium]
RPGPEGHFVTRPPRSDVSLRNQPQLPLPTPAVPASSRPAGNNRLRRYLNTPYLPGLNRLLERLDLAADAYEKDERLKPATVLVRRARSDFEAAIVCTFSGLSFACRDQMRDVMEVEYLLRGLSV